MRYETLKSFKQIYFLKIGKVSVQQNNKATKQQSNKATKQQNMLNQDLGDYMRYKLMEFESRIEKGILKTK